MPTIVSGQVGPQVVSDGVKGVECRQGRTAEQVVSEGHGRYTEPAYRGSMFTVGITGVTLGANHASTTAATATPITGLLNPIGSGKVIAILQAQYVIGATTITTPVNPGIPIFQIAGSSTVTSITGTAPVNMSTLQAKGSVAIGLANNQALTGNTNTWAMLRALFLPATLTTVIPNASVNVNVGGCEEVAGLIFVPPGYAIGIFVLASGTNITNVSSSLTWEELPL